jgi:hypothetical protein
VYAVAQCRSVIAARCGRLWYFPIENLHILRANLTGQPLYLSNIGVLVINEELAAEVRAKKWANVALYRLPVVDTPRDGLPIDLDQVRPESLAAAPTDHPHFNSMHQDL